MNVELQRTINQTFGRYRKTEVKKVNSKMVIKYTRVSGKKQFDTNESIENQNRAINEFAQKLNFEIVASFGDTHESAKTDDRKEFQRMIEFCKRSKGKISTILVYKMTRFSRTGGKAISIADELRTKYGIHIIAVSEPIDTSNPNGVLFQEMQLIFAKWDNVQRQQVTSAGMKQKFLKGEWLGRAPQGYSIIKGDGNRRLVINETGQKIKKAWQWKLQGMRNEDIAAKLTKMGVPMYKQQIYKIFKNPFYCGLVCHGMLEGKVVEGKHERMISQEDFFKIHSIRAESSRFGVSHKKENDELPLKVFTKCDDCKQSMTGYIVKKKNLYYYKCRTKGCKCNKSANDMHRYFINELGKLAVNNIYTDAIAYELEQAYNEQNKETADKEAYNKKRLSEIKTEMERLDVKYYVKDEMDKVKYDRFCIKLMNEENEILKDLEDNAISISNLKSKIVKAVELCSKLPSLWRNSDYAEKEILQKLVFPEGIYYNKKNQAFRTEKINEVFSQISSLSSLLAQKTKGLSVTKNTKSLFAEK